MPSPALCQGVMFKSAKELTAATQIVITEPHHQFELLLLMVSETLNKRMKAGNDGRHRIFNE